MTLDAIVKTLSWVKFPLQNEKLLQAEISKVLPLCMREYTLHDSNGACGTIDFFSIRSGVGVEIKIQGGKKQIYRQVKRYCDSFEIKALVLVTNRSMGLPAEINGKPCVVVNLGEAWL